MTKAEAGRIGNAVVRARAAARRAEVMRYLESGMGIKRAAFAAGVSYRTAKRYRQQAQQGAGRA